MHLSRKKIFGFSLVEVAVATAILAFGLTGIYNLYLFGLMSLRAAGESSVANNNLTQRLDQIQRTPGWLNVTSPSYIQTLLSNPINTTTQNLPGIVRESVTISAVALPYASPTPTSTPSPTATPAPFTVTKTFGSSGSVVVNSSSSLSTAPAVKVIMGIQWKDRSGRSHTRELSTILSNAGISRY